ncbi:MAG TPA: LemA family protein [bacterium]|nr:LemA family protein [bacterium]HPJ71450.1 LemA family protein [bacterium]HPQ66566.1 LemA family protein [bacterium]
MIALWVIVGLIVVIAIWVVGAYNGLVRLRQRVRNAWSQIDVQLKRRFDLIPNLVETVKGYAAHEKEVFTRVTEARAAIQQAGSVDERARAENMLTQTLKSLFAVAENYPQLKANQNFLSLQEELTSTENRISFARQHYNDQVMILNTRIETFPSNLVAGKFGFTREPFFETEAAAEKEPVKVSF